MKKINLKGLTFGRLIVLEESDKRGKHLFWKCLCSCGNISYAATTSLRNAGTISCGCLRNEMIVERSLTHGHSIGRKSSKELSSWQKAKSRCFNTNDPKYKNYGGRGITMCQSWIDDFMKFYNYMGKCPKGYTLDRINVNGNYEPGNCRWADSSTQANNKTTSVYVDYKGEKLTIAQFAKKINKRTSFVHAQIRYKNKSVQDILNDLR